MEVLLRLKSLLRVHRIVESSWAGREWLMVGKMKGKCPKFGLLFLHICYAPISHFPPPPFPHSFFLSWGNHPASHFFCEEGIPSVVGCVPLWQDTWIDKTTWPRMQRASFRIIRKVIFLLQWGQSGWWGGKPKQTHPCEDCSCLWKACLHPLERKGWWAPLWAVCMIVSFHSCVFLNCSSCVLL